MNNNQKVSQSNLVGLSTSNIPLPIKENKMKITSSNIIRISGLSAIASGLIFAGIQPFHPADVISSVHSSLFITLTTLKTLMCLLGIFGITGLYARQVEKTGWLGLAGYLLVTTFYAIQMCFAFIEPFVLPLLTNLAPTFVESALGLSSGVAGPLNLGAFATIYAILPILYLLGLVLFGIAIFRARILSRWAAILLAISGPLAFVMGQVLPHQLERLAAVPMGIALAWLGFSLLTEKRKSAAESFTGMVTPQPVKVGAD